MIDEKDFLRDSLLILHETFEGSPEGQSSAFLDRGTGVFSTVSGLTAEQVSEEISGTTIVAHVEHLKFYMDRLVEFVQGRTEPVNWEQSWLIDTVNEEEWDLLRNGLRNSYEGVLKCIAGEEKWDQDNIGEIISIIAHTAYHLGAIRQLAKSLNH